MKIILLIAFLFLAIKAIGQDAANEPVVSTIKGISHVSLSVRELNRAVMFYKNVVGLQETNRYRIKASTAIEKKSGFAHTARTVAVMQGPNARIELIQFDGAAKQPASTMPIPGPGITHICYQIPSVASVYAQAKAGGASVVSRGTTMVDRGYGIKYAYIRDVDSLLFEIEQIEKPKFSDSVWVGHVAIVTHDIDRLVAFYKQLLGVDPQNRIDNIKNSPKLNDIANIDDLRLRGAWFKTGNMMLEIWQFDNPATVPPTNTARFNQIGYQQIGFEVRDIDRAYKRLAATGVNFLSAPVKTGESSSVFLRDPDGNLLSLQAFEANSPNSVATLKPLTW